MRVVIADDSLLVREGLARLLGDADVEVLAKVDNAASLTRAVADLGPHAVVVDIRMPPTHTNEGIAVAHTLRLAHPQLGILVLSQYLESHYAATLLSDAPEHVGYLLKDRVSDVAVVVDALRRVIAGECVIDPTIVTTLLRRPRHEPALARLSDRERDVLALMAEGRTNKAIADSLAFSSKTVEAHVGRIMAKLDLPETPDDNRRVLAVLQYLRQ